MARLKFSCQTGPIFVDLKGGDKIEKCYNSFLGTIIFSVIRKLLLRAFKSLI